MHKEMQRPPTAEERFDYLGTRLVRAMEGQAVRLASDGEGLLHLEVESSGKWGIHSDREEAFIDYGKVDLATARHLLAYVVSPEFRKIETTTFDAASYMDAVQRHMAVHGELYDAQLLTSMEQGLGMLLRANYVPLDTPNGL